MFGPSHSKERCNAKTIPITCRFCGEEVYYFSCDHGAKVFFEKLGPPWTRHIHEEKTGVVKVETQTDFEGVETYFKNARLILKGVLADHQFDIEFLTATIEFLTTTIEDIADIRESVENQKSKFESDLIETTKFLEDSNEKVLIKGSHREQEIGKPLSGPQRITINSKQYYLTTRQVEDLKAAYNADKRRNPKAGPGGVIKRVLVSRGIIPEADRNHAWNAVARIVGHLTPAQKRSRGRSR